MDSTLGELQLMLEDNAGSRSPFRATDLVWTRICDDFRVRIAARGTTNLDEFNSRFASYLPGDRHYEGYARHMGVAEADDWYAAACEAYQKRLIARDRHNVLLKTQQDVSWDWLTSCEEVISILEVMPVLATDPLVVVDLGSGWGRIGQVITAINPSLTYVACDIPESLIVAQTQLPTRITVPTHLYSETRSASVFTEGVWFCGPQRLDTFRDKSVDLFINAFSFQEMTMQQVSEYFDVIDRLTRGLLYTQQRKRGDQLTRENYPYRQEWKQAYDRESIFSSVYFEAAYWI